MPPARPWVSSASQWPERSRPMRKFSRSMAGRTMELDTEVLRLDIALFECSRRDVCAAWSKMTATACVFEAASKAVVSTAHKNPAPGERLEAAPPGGACLQYR